MALSWTMASAICSVQRMPERSVRSTAATVTVAPATVQTPGVVELKVTGRPELAVALIAKGSVPMATFFSGQNAIVCRSGSTVAESIAV